MFTKITHAQTARTHDAVRCSCRMHGGTILLIPWYRDANLALRLFLPYLMLKACAYRPTVVYFMIVLNLNLSWD